MEFQTIVLEKASHIAKLTLNRPERLNALNEQMFRELNSALQDYLDYGLPTERRQELTLRLSQTKEVVDVGAINLE